jgi:hypothetical protein
MNKTAAALLTATLAATSCASGTTTASPTDTTVVEAMNIASSTSDLSSIDQALLEIDAALPVALSQADRDGLAFMREEEKLARDVYQALYDVWGLEIFDNIAASEQRHTDSVLELLNRFGLPDPAEGLAPGEFSNPELQALYDDLVETGSQSSTDALKVGALIEELDITDLRLRASTQPDIETVYSTLERGSSNHLRAFIRQLERRDVTYTPVHLDQDAFDQILDSSTAQRGQNSPRGSRGRGRA